MVKIAYWDCPTGIAGDMCLGALVDAGVPFDYLKRQLATLGLTTEYTLRVERVLRQGIAATRFHVDLVGDSHPPLRTLPMIEGLIGAASLPPRVQDWSLAIFRTLAEAEAAVHGTAVESIHFHEVGATDALVDIVGTCLGLDWLGVEALYCSPLPTGGGTVRAAHGRLPVPVPAVLQLWQRARVPVYGNGIERELVTPTGAAIVTTLAQQFGPCPALKLHGIGLGAGHHDLPIPNILRLWIGEGSSDVRLQEASGVAQGHHEHGHQHHHGHTHNHEHEHHEHHHDHEHSGHEHSGHEHGHSQGDEHDHGHHHHSHESGNGHEHHHDHEHHEHPGREHGHTHHHSLGQNDSGLGTGECLETSHSQEPQTEPVVLLQTQLDDLNPQAVGYLLDALLQAGALDVFTTAIGMKKSRLGTLLSVLCSPSQVMTCEQLIFRETTTLGIRRSLQERHILHRRIEPVTTPYGVVRLKIAWDGDNQHLPCNVQPEYEDCATLARQLSLPWRHIHQTALHHWHLQHQ
jgi:uncharacterized protein (DUF111 family)